MAWPPMRIHWAWVPAGVFFAMVGWARYGLVGALLIIAAGLGVGALVEWRARRRSRGP